jgi:hypothetical protein
VFLAGPTASPLATASSARAHHGAGGSTGDGGSTGTGSTGTGSTGTGGSTGGSVVSCDKTIVPGQSVQTLVDSLSAGQTGCLHGGSYSEDVTPHVHGAAGAPITIASYPGERATITGILYVPAGSTYLTFAHLNLVGRAGGSIAVQLFGDNATLSHDDITNNHQGPSCVIVGEYEGSWATVVSNATIQANRIHDCGMLANGAHDHGIYLASSRYASVTDNLIWGNQGGWGIQLWADAHYSKVAHNVIDQNYNGSIIIAGGDYSTLGPTSDNSITQNVMTAPQTNYNVDSYWQNGAVGTNNAVTANCLYAAPGGDFGDYDSGYSETNTLHANPQYLDPAHHDYRLQTTSPCLPAIGYDTATTTQPG